MRPQAWFVIGAIVAVLSAVIAGVFFLGEEATELAVSSTTSAADAPAPLRRAPSRERSADSAPNNAAADSRRSMSEAAKSSTTDLVFGVVEDENGRPIDGVEVFLQKCEVAGGEASLTKKFAALFDDFDAVERTVSRDGGKVRFAATASGRYDVLLLSKAHAAKTFRDVLVRDTRQGEPNRFVVRRGYEVKGRVKVASAKALEGLRVVGIVGGEFESQHVHPTRILAVCNEKGEFTILGAAEGELAIGVVGPGLPFTIAEDISVPYEKGLVEIELDDRAVLFGRVTDEKSQPIPGARLSFAFEHRSLTLATAVTSKDGTYEVRAMPGSRMEFALVAADGFAASATIRNRDDRTASRLTEGKNERNFVLSLGTTIRGVVVARDDRSPIAGARVAAIQPAGVFGTVPTAMTGADGSFAIDHVGKGDTIVAAEKTGWIDQEPLARRVAFIDSSRTDRETAAKTPPGFIEVGNSAPPPVTIELDRAPVLAGQVVDSEGRPVVGASVRIEADDDARKKKRKDGDVFDRSTTAGSGVTDDAGNFAFPAMLQTEERTIVAAEADGYLKSTVDVFAENAEKKISIVLHRGAVIEGKVTARGRPIEGAIIKWRNAAEATTWNHIDLPIARTNADGDYRLTSVKPGNLDIRAMAEGMAEKEVQDLDVKDGSVVMMPFDLVPSLPISGRVVDHDGDGVKGALVYASLGASASDEESVTLPEPARTDGQGRFEFIGTEPRNLNLVAVHPDKTCSRIRSVVPGEKDVVLQIPQRLSIRGEVRHQGRPVAKVEISIIPDDPNYPTPTIKAQSLPNGSFELKRVPAGSYTLYAKPSSSVEEHQLLMPTRVEKVNAGASGVRVEMSNGVLITGTARRADGGSLEGQSVGLSTYVDPKSIGSFDRIKLIRKSTTIQNGRFQFAGLSSDRYVLTIADREYAEKKVDVTAPAENVEMVIGGGCRIVGRLAPAVLRDGAKRHFFKLTGNTRTYTFICAPDGSFAVEGVDPGRYKFQISSREYEKTVFREVDVPESGTIDLGEIGPTK